MIRKMAVVALSLMTMFATFNVQAAGKGNKKKHHNPSCVKLQKACEAAGYSSEVAKDDPKRRGKACVKPILAGLAIEGVSVAESDIQACKAHREAKQAKKDRKLKRGKDAVHQEPDSSGSVETPIDSTAANPNPGII